MPGTSSRSSRRPTRRRVFPCFDEPSYKSPWQLTLTIPAGSSAVSNTPIVSESPAPGGGARRALREDRAPAGVPRRLRRRPLRLRRRRARRNEEDADPHRRPEGARPRGRATRPRRRGRSSSGSRLTSACRFRSRSSTSSSFPQAVTFSAMENAGLITWAESVAARAAAGGDDPVQAGPGLDQRPRDGAPVVRRLRDARVVGRRLAERVLRDVDGRPHAPGVAADLGCGDRPGRRPLQRHGGGHPRLGAQDPPGDRDLRRHLQRLRRHLLPEGRRRHLDVRVVDRIGQVPRRSPPVHAGASLRHRDLEGLSRGDQAESRPGVAAAFSSFSTRRACPSSTSRSTAAAAPKLSLSQKRFLPVGSAGAAGQTWQIPVCARSGDGPKECMLLKDASGAMPAPSSGGGCPSWVLANDGEIGYYRAALPRRPAREAHVGRRREADGRRAGRAPARPRRSRDGGSLPARAGDGARAALRGRLRKADRAGRHADLLRRR